MDGEEFLRRMSCGDPSVWDDLMPMLHRLARGACHKLGIHDAAHDDILQDVAVRAFTHWQSYKGQSQLSTWLYSIARNRCIDELRKRKVRGDGDNKKNNSPEDASDDSPPDQGYDPKYELVLCVQQLLAELEAEIPTRRGGRRKFDVLMFWVQHSPTMEELAGFLDTTVAAAKQRMYEIRKHVEGLCRKFCGHDDCSLQIDGGRS